MKTYDSANTGRLITVNRDDDTVVSTGFESYPALKLVQSFVKQAIAEIEKYYSNLPYNQETQEWLNKLNDFDQFVTRVRG